MDPVESFRRWWEGGGYPSLGFKCVGGGGRREDHHRPQPSLPITPGIRRSPLLLFEGRTRAGASFVSVLIPDAPYCCPLSHVVGPSSPIRPNSPPFEEFSQPVPWTFLNSLTPMLTNILGSMATALRHPFPPTTHRRGRNKGPTGPSDRESTQYCR